MQQEKLLHNKTGTENTDKWKQFCSQQYFQQFLMY